MLRAETVLAKMDVFEDTAALAEDHPSEKLRRGFAERYQNHVGFEPSVRHDLRPVLEGIKAHGLRSVEDAISDMRLRYVKRLGGSADGDSRASR
jgi:hypothetical protein